MNNAVGKIVAPFPRVTSTQMLAMRTMKKKRTLNDLVEDIHLKLLDDEEKAATYDAFLDAVHDEEAIEGTTRDDDHEAARMIRDKAKELKVHEVSSLKIATIRHVLNIVMRRYSISRKERRYGFTPPPAQVTSPTETPMAPVDGDAAATA